MKFRDKKLILGTRFYIFTSEDEYRIVTLVKSNEKDGQFMDEETFKLEIISEQDLNDDYIMLTNCEEWILCKFTLKEEFKKDPKYKDYEDSSFWFYNHHIIHFLDNQCLSYPYTVKLTLRIMMYKYITKTVLNKIMNYIIKLNNSNFELSNKDFDNIWLEYFNSLEKDGKIILKYPSNEEKKIKIKDNQISDIVLYDAEQIIGNSILYYDIYEYNYTINFNRINMKYFMLYLNDKYYIILYNIDKTLETIAMRKNLKEHMDVVDFMLK